VHVEVGHVVHAERQAPVLELGDIAAARVLQLAEVAAERHLLLVGHRLAVEDEHGILVHAGLDGSHLLGRDGPGDVDARHLTHEHGADLADGDGHGGVSSWLLGGCLSALRHL
jgi:hypothetical protein